MLLAATVFGQPALRLKQRRFETHADLQEHRARPYKSMRWDRAHWIVQFQNAPAGGQLQELERRGALILGYVPDHAVMIRAPQDIPLDGMGARWAGRLGPEDKFDPVQPAAIAATDTPGMFVVAFHPDVAPEERRQLVQDLGLEVREHPDLLPAQLLVRGITRDVARLTEWDEVAYIFPASDELAAERRTIGCAGALTEFGPAGEYTDHVGEGWDGPGLGSAELSYYFEKLTSQLSEDQQKTEIQRAMAEWSRAAQITFTATSETSRTRTLNFLFAAKAHGDPYSFDGRGRVLAHTFYPAPANPEPLAGDVHLDDDEQWHIGADTDLFSIALHELGHALGLGHSDNPNAVMYAYYKRVTGLTKLDIADIQQLYAAPSEKPAQPSSPTQPTSPPSPGPTPPPTPQPTTPTQPTPSTPTATPTPGGVDKTAPSLTITSPASASVLTSAAVVTVRGTARDNTAVTEVTWSTSGGQTGTATGTTSWACTDIPLLVGANTITIRARDAAGNTGWRAIVVTRR